MAPASWARSASAETTTAPKVIAAAIEAYGQIDILVCNAGVGWQYGEEHPGTMAGVHEASLENWRDIVGGVDLEGYFTMFHAALPHMLEREKGSIVSIASMAGMTGLYDAHAYTATKGALINLTRSMGITYAKQGVRANCVCPGFIDTPLIEPAIDLFKTHQATSAAKVEFHELLRENKQLHRAVQSADEPAVVERTARRQGLIAEGERPFVLHGLQN